MAIQTSDLQQAVLRYLTENGSAKWGALYSHFYQGNTITDEIGSALQHLAQGKHIAVELDGTTKITESGSVRLKRA